MQFTSFAKNNILNTSFQYESKDKVIITNFPTGATSTYNPKEVAESFRITKQGLISYRPIPVPPPPKPNQLNNAFILYSYDTNEEVVRIEFDISGSSQKLVATSTGKIYNRAGAFQVFQFFGMNSNRNDVFASGAVLGNDNGDEFVKGLNGQIENFGEAVYVGFLHRSQVVLTNYPNIGDNYRMLDKNAQSFLITRNGIVENLLPNIITLKSSNNDLVIIIKFDFLATKILCQPKRVRVNLNSDTQEYFVMTLFKSDGITIREKGKILSGQDGTALSTTFYGQAYSFNEILQLDYLDRTKVEISNYPNKGDATYNPTETSQRFKITNNGLVAI